MKLLHNTPSNSNSKFIYEDIESHEHTPQPFTTEAERAAMGNLEIEVETPTEKSKNIMKAMAEAYTNDPTAGGYFDVGGAFAFDAERIVQKNRGLAGEEAKNQMDLDMFLSGGADTVKFTDILQNIKDPKSAETFVGKWKQKLGWLSFLVRINQKRALKSSVDFISFNSVSMGDITLNGLNLGDFIDVNGDTAELFYAGVDKILEGMNTVAEVVGKGETFQKLLRGEINLGSMSGLHTEEEIKVEGGEYLAKKIKDGGPDTLKNMIDAMYLILLTVDKWVIKSKRLDQTVAANVDPDQDDQSSGQNANPSDGASKIIKEVF